MEHIRCVNTLGLHLNSRLLQPWLAFDFIFDLTKKGRESRECARLGNKLAMRAIKGRKALRQRVQQSNKSLSITDTKVSIEENEKETSSSCFLDQLLDLEDEGLLTEEEVMNELNTFITAGYDTSGMTIANVLFYLSYYPEYQEKVVEEIVSVIAPTFGFDPTSYEVTPSDTRKMKFLELCVKESLRLIPIAAFLPRMAVEDVRLPDGRIIPEGTNVIINVYQIHQDPNYFPEPHKYIPERHLKPNSAYIPFSCGPRNCIGQVYGMHEIKTILTYLLLSYKWETTERLNFELVLQALLVPKNGLNFKITKRKHPMD